MRSVVAYVVRQTAALTRWLLLPPPLPISEALEAHRTAWRRIEVRRQEFAPPDLHVCDRIRRGFGLSSKRYYGYEARKASHASHALTRWPSLRDTALAVEATEETDKR